MEVAVCEEEEGGGEDEEGEEEGEEGEGEGVHGILKWRGFSWTGRIEFAGREGGSFWLRIQG